MACWQADRASVSWPRNQWACAAQALPNIAGARVDDWIRRGTGQQNAGSLASNDARVYCPGAVVVVWNIVDEIDRFGSGDGVIVGAVTHDGEGFDDTILL